MFLKELLSIEDEIFFVEESYLAQRTIKNTLRYLNGVRSYSEGRKMRLLRIREGEHTLGLLIFNPADEESPVDFWSVFTGALATVPLKNEFETIADSLLSLNPPEKDIEICFESWRDVINEYYSFMLVNRNLCHDCTVRYESYKNIFSENRVQKVENIFSLLQKKGIFPEGRLLEVCCGNGMSTLALYRLGLNPLAIEINKCVVCQGLEQGVLNPKRVLVMDATSISKYFEPGSFDTITGFMLGLVYEFNKELWINIMRETASVASEGALLIFTVSSKPEIEILAGALRRVGIKGEIVDNTDYEGTYDQWLFIGRKVGKGSTSLR
jgi:SAM-dependent methyltransferase